MFYRESWVEVDLDQIKENIRWLRRQTDRQFIAVIKANGYGVGDGPVARAALEAGAAIRPKRSCFFGMIWRCRRYRWIGLRS